MMKLCKTFSCCLRYVMSKKVVFKKGLQDDFNVNVAYVL